MKMGIETTLKKRFGDKLVKVVQVRPLSFYPLAGDYHRCMNMGIKTTLEERFGDKLVWVVQLRPP